MCDWVFSVYVCREIHLTIHYQYKSQLIHSHILVKIDEYWSSTSCTHVFVCMSKRTAKICSHAQHINAIKPHFIDYGKQISMVMIQKDNFQTKKTWNSLNRQHELSECCEHFSFYKMFTIRVFFSISVFSPGTKSWQLDHIQRSISSSAQKQVIKHLLRLFMWNKLDWIRNYRTVDFKRPLLIQFGDICYLLGLKIYYCCNVIMRSI